MDHCHNAYLNFCYSIVLLLRQVLDNPQQEAMDKTEFYTFRVPDTAEEIIKKQEQRSATSTKQKLRRFQVGDKLYVKDFAGWKAWIPGTIVDIKGPLSYKVNVGSWQACRWHVDQVRSLHDDILDFVMPSMAEEEWIDNGPSITIITLQPPPLFETVLPLLLCHQSGNPNWKHRPIDMPP